MVDFNIPIRLPDGVTTEFVAVFDELLDVLHGNIPLYSISHRWVDLHVNAQLSEIHFADVRSEIRC